MKAKDTKFSTKQITSIGIFGAISGLIMLLEIPLPFAPAFYKLDLSEVPTLIITFAYGPLAGTLTELLKVLVKLVTKGTSTAFVGEIANFIVGCFFLIPSGIIYMRHKTKKQALMACIAGTISLTVLGSLLNAVYLLPAFSRLYGIPMDAIVEMGRAVNPAITDVTKLVLFCTVPFNLLKGIIDSLITMLIYKRISPIIH